MKVDLIGEEMIHSQDCGVGVRIFLMDD